MEIRDPIHGSIELTPTETAVVDSPFFQRLRNIKQMGFAEFSYPGATHNRYTHSIGAMHLAGIAFDQIFQGFAFSAPEIRWRLRQTVRLGALLHDVGHGPLSHSTEEVMPSLRDLGLKIYPKTNDRRANHEDFTIKIITDSGLTDVLRKNFPDLEPDHVARLVNRDLPDVDDFFRNKDLDLRPLLSQIISSELDVDRLDYLARDSYYCGTSYGHVDRPWLMANLTYYQNDNKLNLALNHRALHTFDDFLLSRYHMFMMVYFHHKGLIYEEMLYRYLRSQDCDFSLPGDIDEYRQYDDYKLYSHMSRSRNSWAKLIANRQPFRMLLQTHADSRVVRDLEQRLINDGIEIIKASSKGRLSKYYTGESEHEPIFVVDADYAISKKITKIEESTDIFEKYRNPHTIERIYVNRNDYQKAQQIMGDMQQMVFQEIF